MPAYRSAAEGEVREAVVEHLRRFRPEARIMHEVNASSWGNRIDVLAVSPAEIVAVEIKSAKDKLDRLADQLAAMRKVAHFAIAALHEKFLVEKPCGAHAASVERDGNFYIYEFPDGVAFERGWAFPVRRRALRDGWHDRLATWRLPDPACCEPLPSGALDMLWREELHEMCFRLGVQVPKRATMGQMVPALRWNLSGRDLTRGICAALRARVCVEADPAIVETD